MNQSTIEAITLSQPNRLSWQQFEASAIQRKMLPPQFTTSDNRLVCATHNFFVIVGIGAFVLGYLIIVTKKPYASIAIMSAEQHEEMEWLVKILSNLLITQYNRDVVCFEHGMCGCSGNENAHLHMMPVSKKATAKDFEFAINQVLDHRGIGITDPIDRELRRNLRSEKSNQEVWSLAQLTRLPLHTYPKLDNQLGKYVYFRSPFASASFLTDANLGSQVGREIVFEVEKYHNKTLQKKLKRLSKGGMTQYGQLPWRWQDFAFSENIVKTMHHLTEPLLCLQNSTAAEKFGFKSYLAIKPNKQEQSFYYLSPMAASLHRFLAPTI